MRHHGAVGTRILTVEDDERIRTAVKLALEDEGWIVEETGQRRGCARGLRPSAGRRRPDRHHAPRHRRVRAVPLDPPSRATCRSSWSPPAPTPTTSSPGSRRAPTTTSPSRSRRRSCRPASGPCCAGRAVPSPDTPACVFGDLEIVPDEGVVLARAAGGPPHQDRVPPAVRAGVEPRPGVQPRGRCSTGSGATATSATGASSTSTCAACAPRSRPTPPTPATSSPCGGSATSSRP